MGLVTVCIGTGPFGLVAIGSLSERLGAPAALLAMALAGATGPLATRSWLRRHRP